MNDEKHAYNGGVMAGRPPHTAAPAFGRRLAALRQQQGLTQTQLADRLGTTQKRVDYYERRAQNPTLDVVQKVAEALECAPAELIGDDATPLKMSRKAGPTGKVQKAFEDVSRLPRRQQEQIVKVVTALVSQYEQARQ